MRLRALGLAALLVALLAAGCGPWHALHRPVPPAQPGSTDWLADLQQVRDLDPGGGTTALQRREAAVKSDPTPQNHLRLALLLAFGPSGVRDDDRALALARSAADAATTRGTYTLARHVVTVETERLNARAQRRRLDKRLDAERARAQELAHKLEALKSIEENLNRRTQDTDTGPSP
ncbi:MAG TPA: hypothetical protein VKA14_08725 [Gammaproteobacteria bacterium]|nr:hypothetical protein [Gammaproteobacteria bacterium]